MDEDFDLWAEEMCRRLKLEPGFRKEDLVRAVAREMNCSIELREHDMEGSYLYGMCSVEGASFIIAYRHDSPLAQRFHTVCHEIAHILRGHVTLSTAGIAYREFDASDEQEDVAEQCARALIAFALGDRPIRRRRMGIARFWVAVGGED